MGITTRVDRPRQLTVHEVTGEVYPEEIRETIRSFYMSPEPTRDILWDFRLADWEVRSLHEFREVVAISLQENQDGFNVRRGGKTAFVVSKKLGLGIFKMGEFMLEASQPKLPFEIQVLYSMEEANDWLSQPREAE